MTSTPQPSGTSDPLRDRQMRDLICRLNLLSHVPASAASPTGGPATDEHETLDGNDRVGR